MPLPDNGSGLALRATDDLILATDEDAARQLKPLGGEDLNGCIRMAEVTTRHSRSSLSRSLERSCVLPSTPNGKHWG